MTLDDATILTARAQCISGRISAAQEAHFRADPTATQAAALMLAIEALRLARDQSDKAIAGALLEQASACLWLIDRT